MSDNTEGRQQWSSKNAFILAAIGSAVGLGNIWRFPYVVYTNGGGAYLIPYFTAIVTAGIPLLILEYSLGHKFRSPTPLAMKKANPKFEWVGWLPSLGAGVIVLYYIAIISWALNYMWFSLSRAWGATPEAFFYTDFLATTESAFQLNSIRWPVLIGLIIIWFLSWLAMYKQVKGIEKANKVLLPALLVMAIIIVVRSLFLPGSIVGVNELFTPQWDQLTNPDIWMAAYGQVFFSLSVAMGIMMTFASYLPKDSDINNSALVMAFSNSAFEFTFAIGVFAILGFMATTMNVPVDQVVSSGIGLSFVVFPQCFNEMPAFLGSLLGVAFFGSLVFAGFTSLVSLIEAFSAPFIEKFGISRKKFITWICIGGGLISSVYATGAGVLILDIVDFFVNSYVLVVVGFLEAVYIGWFYGTEKVREHANSTSIIKIGKWWDVCIKYVIPIVLGVTIVRSLIDTIKNGYGDYSTEELVFFGVCSVGVCVLGSFILSALKGKKQDSNIEE